MTTKRKTENDLLVTPAAPAAPARRKTVARTRTRRAGTAEKSAAPAAGQPAVTPENAVAVTVSEPSYEEIALLAFTFWEARGCCGGSAEEDWLRAEHQLRARTCAAVAVA